jgi:hydroxypyruvate reductase
MPREAVLRALEQLPKVTGRTVLVAIGKAAWTMAEAALEVLGDRVDTGIVITKYDHACGELRNVRVFEAGHPVPDEGTLIATRAALELTKDLTREDLVLFLVSGGGSALFESVDCSLEELQQINRALLAGGASIDEVNVVRKHLSGVKGGRFALHCAPAQVFSVLLSDVLGDRVDTIASGPAVPDESTVEQALSIAARCGVPLTDATRALLMRETPKSLSNASYVVGGSVRELCAHAAEAARSRGYCVRVLTDELCCEAAEAGAFLASEARAYADTEEPIALIAGGETVVHLRGNGLGGRNQELALSAALGIAGMENVALISVGSDGTDGPTDAAGGYVDGATVATLQKKSMDARSMLFNNDSYHALEACDGLIVTGPTGTNVNDVAVVLILPNRKNG